MASEIGLFVDEGLLPEGPISTVLRRSVIGGGSSIELFREGAITLLEIQELVPSISAVEPN